MKPLDSWARQFGYADFDTYIQAGGSINDVRRDIAKRIHNLQIALDALDFTPSPPMAETPPPKPPSNFHTEPPGHTLELRHDEPPDPDNAQIQGAEFG
jgi:hypothetical protein